MKAFPSHISFNVHDQSNANRERSLNKIHNGNELHERSHYHIFYFVYLCRLFNVIHAFLCTIVDNPIFILSSSSKTTWILNQYNPYSLHRICGSG